MSDENDVQLDPVPQVLAKMRRNWPEIDVPGLEQTLAVQRLASLLEELTRHALADYALSPTEFEVLAALRSHGVQGRLTPSQLYDALLISSGGLTKVLKGLERRGLISRSRSESDGRSKPVFLTDAGRHLTEKAMIAAQGAHAPVFAEQEGGFLQQLVRVTCRAENLHRGVPVQGSATDVEPVK